MPPDVRSDPKPAPRIKVSRERWKELRAVKDGPCRICGQQPPNELHHLYSRARGGDDVPENLVPLCTVCHDAVTCNDTAALRVLYATITDDEAGYLERTCGLRRVFGAAV